MGLQVACVHRKDPVDTDVSVSTAQVPVVLVRTIREEERNDENLRLGSNEPFPLGEQSHPEQPIDAK